MDKKELQEKIALYYSKLPPTVQTVFSSMKWLETLKTISQKYSLSEKQIETLGTETTLVLLGITHLVEYEEILTNELRLSRDSTDKILMEIEESIIKTIRPQLALAFEANKKSEAEGAPNIESKLDERIKKLPKEIQNIIFESNYQVTLYDIAKEYNLTVTQMGILETAVTNLIIGDVHPEEFENYLKNNLSLTPETIKKLANDVNEKIFLKIRESLKSMSVSTGEPLTKEMKKSDTQVLNSAGIEIIPDLPAVPSAQLMQAGKLELMEPIESRENILNKIEKPEAVHPILEQKLSASVQIPTVKTEHSLENITKTAGTPMPQTPKAYPKNSDPYRLPPEN